MTPATIWVPMHVAPANIREYLTKLAEFDAKRPGRGLK